MEDQPPPPPPLKESDQPPMTPSTLLSFTTPDARTRASNLFDSHELRDLISHLRQGTLGKGPSNLYDSYELRAVATELNKAVRTTLNTMSPSVNAQFLCHGKKSRKLKRIAAVEEPHKSGLLLRIWKKFKWTVLRSQSLQQ